MKKTIFLLLTMCAASLISCNQNEEQRTDNKTINVTLGLPLAIESRTAVTDDGSVMWIEGDKIALWAKASDESYELSGNILSMLHYSSTKHRAYFSANIPAMSQGEYTYYASSPAPSSVDGTNAYYTIPALQNGSNKMTDIMVAEPITASQLIDGDNNLDLRFSHSLHAVKITIPQDGNLLGRPLTAFQMTFPTAVVGDIAIDVSNPTAAPALLNGSNSVRFEFDEPKQAGDSFWAVLYPSLLEGEVTYKGFSDGYESKEKTFSINKQLVAGHVTPMELIIPILDRTTIIRFVLGDNFLGEDVQTLRIKNSAGNTILSYNLGSSKTADSVFEGEWSVPSYSGQELVAEFESESAIVSSKFTMPALTPYITNVVPTLTVPYLFYEDFSGITKDGTFQEDENSTNPEGTLLDSYGLPGWSIARGSVSAGNCVRVNCSFETGIYAKADYKGQVDTPALSAIKSGKTISVKVVFNADTSEDKTACFVGNLTTTGAIKAESSISNGTSISLTAQSGISYSSLFTERSVTIGNNTSSSRIAFESNSQRSGELSVKYYDHYIYIDNIRISIAK